MPQSAHRHVESEPAVPRPVKSQRRESPFERRATLVVHFAMELAGVAPEQVNGDITLPLSAAEFQRELQKRYGVAHPELAFRSMATVERARLQRDRLSHLPRIILRQGPPPRGQR
ncbi:MAG TPA: hypothetical protein VMT49_02010 [Steroidobacteraceae bacterium]|nr:hypothetical protein [Steroidobacteraceae bacterium]